MISSKATSGKASRAAGSTSSPHEAYATFFMSSSIEMRADRAPRPIV